MSRLILRGKMWTSFVLSWYGLVCGIVFSWSCLVHVLSSSCLVEVFVFRLFTLSSSLWSLWSHGDLVLSFLFFAFMALLVLEFLGLTFLFFAFMVLLVLVFLVSLISLASLSSLLLSLDLFGLFALFGLCLVILLVPVSWVAFGVSWSPLVFLALFRLSCSVWSLHGKPCLVLVLSCLVLSCLVRNKSQLDFSNP